MYKINDPKFIALIEKGISIKRLEKRLRPTLNSGRSWSYEAEAKKHGDWEGYSGAGFLGKNESLLKVIHSDWQVVERYRTTHGEIADALDKIVAETFDNRAHGNTKPLEKYQLHPDYEFVQATIFADGFQSCPWDCDVSTAGGEDVGIFVRKGIPVKKDTTIIEQTIEIQKKYRKKEILCAPVTSLLPHLIREHYFFEGKESPYRADPVFLIKALNLARYL